MPRKPAPIELAGGKGLRQRLWDRIRAAREPFAVADLLHGGEDESTAREYITGLFNARYLGVVRAAVIRGSADQRCPALYSLVRDVGAEAPRVRRDGTPVTQGMAQEQMWRTLRMMRGDINARELAAHASTPQVPVSPIAANDYLRHLRAAGYLAETMHGQGTGRGGVQSRYRLRLDTGPRAPMVCRAHCLYDPNRDETILLRNANEEDAIYGS